MEKAASRIDCEEKKLDKADHPKFKVSKRSVRDRLILLQQSTKQK